jgi:phage gp29-like protein
LSLTERISASLNPESVILPLDVTISDAIMNLQDMGFEVTQAVFAKCGTPRVLSKREALAEDAHDKREAKVDMSPKMPLSKSMDGVDSDKGRRRTNLERALGDVRKAVSDALNLHIFL